MCPSYKCPHTHTAPSGVVRQGSTIHIQCNVLQCSMYDNIAFRLCGLAFWFKQKLVEQKCCNRYFWSKALFAKALWSEHFHGSPCTPNEGGGLASEWYGDLRARNAPTRWLHIPHMPSLPKVFTCILYSSYQITPLGTFGVVDLHMVGRKSLTWHPQSMCKCTVYTCLYSHFYL